MSSIATSVLLKLKLETTPAKVLTSISKLIIERDLLSEKGSINNDKMIDYSLRVAKNLPIQPSSHPLTRVIWGDERGNSIITYFEPNGTYSTAIINRTSSPPVYEWLYRDLNDVVIRRVLMLKDREYDPRIRIWYRLAKKTNPPQWTPTIITYRYKDLTTDSITSIHDKKGNFLGVFLIEVELSTLSKFLSTLKIAKNSVAFITNKEDNVIAFPGLADLLRKERLEGKFIHLESTGKPWLPPSLAKYNKTHLNEFRYIYNGVPYLASYTTIPQLAEYGWKIGIVIPENSIIGNLKKMQEIITLIGLGILLLGILLSSIISKRISKPLLRIVGEVEQIKQFNLEGDRGVKSIIKEVEYIADAVQSMKINLRSFKKYLPATLVRQLIQTGEDIKLGGAKKKITFFFSDIAGFTSISETMDPEQLMLHLCEYIDALSKIISEEHGTIDKFIGDSIMAFWGAPLADKKQCQNACTAALKCQKRLSELNREWMLQGKAPLITRIGIHTGVAVVGNIGSSERLNYTALGDAVNIASRLEGMNKFYSSKIIISEEVMRIVKGQFAFRLLDRVHIKGKSGSYHIYELLDESLHFNLNAYQEYFDKGFNAYQHQQWDEAVTYFKQCLKIYPEDLLTPIFIKRCEIYKQAPPSADWDGVWVVRNGE